MSRCCPCSAASWASLWREILRFLHQRSRFVAALVRPLIWLFIVRRRLPLGARRLDHRRPTETYILYDDYIIPGLVAMIQLFNGMQGSLSMVYDREMGSMRVLLTSPMPRWFLLICKLLSRHAAVAGAGLCVPADRLALWRSSCRRSGYLTVLPALLISGLMLGGLGLLLSSMIKQLENFAGRDELHHLPDVLHLLGALSAVEGRGSEPDPARHLRPQSLHLRGRADPLRALWPVRKHVSIGGRRLHDRLRGRRDHRLRPIQGHHHPRARAGAPA